MPDFPDVLDHLGKTPRELGAIHIHVEPIVRGSDGAAVATVWLQAAMLPMAPGGTLRVQDLTLPLPELGDGRVIKGLVPLTLPLDVAELSFTVQCEPAKNAERVRQAWKLFDTFEIARESEMKSYGGDSSGMGGLLLANALTLPLGVVVIPTGGGGGGGSLAESTRTTVHKARTLSAGFVAPVVAGEPDRAAAVRWNVAWSPKEPLPAITRHVIAPTGPAEGSGKSGRRICGACGFSGRREDFGTDRYCPTCGDEWA
jgi:hypothetical protein